MPIEVASLQNGHLAPLIDRDFTVDRVLEVHFTAGTFTFSVKSLPAPYSKTYPPFSEASSAGSLSTLVAKLEDRVAGIVQLSGHWSGFGQVEDLVVSRLARRKGVATALLESAKQWSLSQRLIGLRVESQDTNVPACLLYAHSGFQLSGVDTALYEGSVEFAQETALFWYWRRNLAPNPSIERTC
jgi:GNAT superfamily N-acetyltransferase